MILVDSSAWVEYLRATGSATHHEVRRLLMAQPEQVAVTEPVVLELLAGPTQPDVVAKLDQLLNGLALLQVDAALDYRAAATVYRAARMQGQTVRSLLDCLIAAVAVRSGAALLHQDRDFDVLAGVLLDLRLHHAT